MAKRKNFTFRLDPDIVGAVGKIAENEHRSINNMVEVTLLDLLKAHGSEPQPSETDPSDPE